nr:MAG TPA: hypothetical protein [Caudoviricetes sp.]
MLEILSKTIRRNKYTSICWLVIDAPLEYGNIEPIYDIDEFNVEVDINFVKENIENYLIKLVNGEFNQKVSIKNFQLGKGYIERNNKRIVIVPSYYMDLKQQNPIEYDWDQITNFIALALDEILKDINYLPVSVTEK